MKEIVKSLPLALFLILLCTLSISVYFGNVSEHFGPIAIFNTTTPKTTTAQSTTAQSTTAQSTTAQSTTAQSTTAQSTTPKTTTAATTTAQAISVPLLADITTIIKFLKNMNSSSESDDDKSQKEDPEEWLKQWNEMANTDYADDYIPKTQVFPNVCKKCNNHNNGVCANCRGLGGNETTVSNYKNRFSDFIAAHGSGYKGDGNWAGFGGHDLNNPSVSRVVQDTGSGLVDVTKTALNDATGLAAGAGLGAFALAEDAGSGATGLLRDGASGAVGLAKDLGSGVKDVLKSNPVQLNQTTQPATTSANPGSNNPYQSGYYSQGTYNMPNNPLGIQGIDPYSYNGSLVSKGGNFIPITDDFSSFRK